MARRFIIKDNSIIQEVTSGGMVWQEYNTLEKLVDKLNEQDQTIKMWCKSSKKIIKLLEENTKPTYDNNVYLNIDDESKRCKYENTVICYKCQYFSSYFLDCRLMMGDDQYKKALSLGLVKE